MTGQLGEVECRQWWSHWEDNRGSKRGINALHWEQCWEKGLQCVDRREIRYHWFYVGLVYNCTVSNVYTVYM